MMNVTIDEGYIEIYSSRLKITFYIDLVASLFALYVVITHTPKTMGYYKMFLIDISVRILRLSKIAHLHNVVIHILIHSKIFP